MQQTSEERMEKAFHVLKTALTYLQNTDNQYMYFIDFLIMYREMYENIEHFDQFTQFAIVASAISGKNKIANKTAETILNGYPTSFIADFLSMYSKQIEDKIFYFDRNRFTNNITIFDGEEERISKNEFRKKLSKENKSNLEFIITSKETSLESMLLVMKECFDLKEVE